MPSTETEAAPSAQEWSSTPASPIKEAVLDTAAPGQKEVECNILAAQATMETTTTNSGRRCSVAVPYQQQSVRLVKEKDGQWALAKDGRLVNNLSWVVGFMELANAGDFAANVWNIIPVPVYAIVFMAIGGSVAGFLSIFAFRDAKRAFYNVKYLKAHRKHLLQEKHALEARSECTMDTDVILAINFRELGTEIIARFVMDILMGFGAVLICIGTFLAIDGADSSVYLASNLLSGYIGNTPIALFGLINSSWAGFIFAKAQGHVRASRSVLGQCTATKLVIRRARKVQLFTVVNGTATILGGVGSMITATRWWGYVILIPVIISSLFCNIWWRKMLGYTRSEGHPAIIKDELIYSLEFAARAEVKGTHDPEKLPAWCAEMPSTLADMLEYLCRHSLFHQFCAEIITNEDICQALGGNTADPGAELCITPTNILTLPIELHPTLLDSAKRIGSEPSPEHFRNRHRYLAEVLGTYCSWVTHHERNEAGTQGAAGPRDKEASSEI